MTEQTGANPKTQPSDSAEKTYDKKYVDDLKQEAITNRLKSKELSEKLADMEKDLAQFKKFKAALGGDEVDPDAKLNQVINDNKLLKNALENERRERLILSRASKADVADAELLMSLLRDKNVDENNIDKLIKDEIEKHPVLKAQGDPVPIGVFPTDPNTKMDLRSQEAQAKYMNKLIRSAKNNFA